MLSSFLFSLPTTVDHAELSARLKDHLSAFVHVNLVRIIRDSRGGVCAFVQCNVKFLLNWLLFFSSTSPAYIGFNVRRTTNTKSSLAASPELHGSPSAL
jgi:hypothetical protein